MRIHSSICSGRIKPTTLFSLLFPIFFQFIPFLKERKERVWGEIQNFAQPWGVISLFQVLYFQCWSSFLPAMSDSDLWHAKNPRRTRSNAQQIWDLALKRLFICHPQAYRGDEACNEKILVQDCFWNPESCSNPCARTWLVQLYPFSYPRVAPELNQHSQPSAASITPTNVSEGSIIFSFISSHRPFLGLK